VPPTLALLSDKNRELRGEGIQAVLQKFHLPMDRPLILQVLRFDRFEVAMGLMKAYELVQRYNDCSPVLAGSPATDDREGETVLNEIRQFARNDPDIYIPTISS
jgi:hypothetical protein